MLTHGRLKSVLNYSENTGEFSWKIMLSRRSPIGKIAGGLAMNGYSRICIDGERFLAHRLAWFYVTGHWPINQIDHINGDKKDNRFCNLRDVPANINSQNIFLVTKRNSLGVLGVSRCGEKYRARVIISGKEICVSGIGTKEDAHNKYIELKRKFHPGNTL